MLAALLSMRPVQRVQHDNLILIQHIYALPEGMPDLLSSMLEKESPDATSLIGGHVDANGDTLLHGTAD